MNTNECKLPCNSHSYLNCFSIINVTVTHTNYTVLYTTSYILTPSNSHEHLPSSNYTTPSLKKTLSYDPAKSETFKALQEAELGDTIQEVTVPAQTRVFSPSAQHKVT